MTEAVTLFRLLGDETRFKIICLLYSSDSYVELLAEKLNLTPGTVCFHLKKLENAGLVNCSRRQFYIIYSLNREIFDRTLESFFPPYEKGSQEEEAYREKVLASFYRGCRLQSIPVQQKKRMIVLSHIMEDFTAQAYEEKEVNAILQRHFEDYCTLRRWLIADGFMTREHDIYTVKKQ